jgi:hypothetical protein
MRHVTRVHVHHANVARTCHACRARSAAQQGMLLLDPLMSFVFLFYTDTCSDRRQP